MEKPNNEDCCGSGCNPCIFDVYLKSLEKKLPTIQIFNPIKYIPFLLKNVDNLGFDNFLYTFQALDEKGDPISSAIVLRMSNYAILRADGFSRPYTILFNDFLKIGCFQVIIKIYPDGKMSQRLKNVTIGEKFFWRGPFSHFDYEKTSHILLIGSGTGILPLYNIAKSLTMDENCEAVIHIVGCFRCIDSILLRQELHELTKFWNCSVEYFIEDVSDAHLLYREKITFKKLETTNLKDLFLKFSKTVVSCGSDSFNQFVQKVADDCEIKLIVL